MKVKELIALLLTLEQEEEVWLPVDEEFMDASVVTDVVHSEQIYQYRKGTIPYTYDHPLRVDRGDNTGAIGYILR